MLCGLLEADERHGDGRRRRRQPRSRGREAPHRLHVAALLAVRAADRRSEHPLLRRHLRPRRRAARTRAAASSSRWPASRGASARARPISPAAGASGSRSAAPSCTSRRSSFSTSRPAASIRCRAAQFWRLIDDLSAAGVTVLVTTHYLDEAEHCHRLAIIHAGRLAALGTTDELKQRVRRPRRSSRSTRRIRWRRCGALDADAGGREDQRLRHRRARRAEGRTRRTARRACATGWPRPAWTSPRSAPVQPSLEDVFLDVVEQRGG